MKALAKWVRSSIQTNKNHRHGYQASPGEPSCVPDPAAFFTLLTQNTASMGDPAVFTVAQDGSAQFSTVQAAVDAVPMKNQNRIVIRIAPGIYKQPIHVPKTKNFITFHGTSAESTILSWGNCATNINHHQDSKLIGTGTFGCGTVIVEGGDFIAEGITFENSCPQGSGQAVALRVTADKCAFYGCRFLGWQDTAYLHFGRQYFRDCYFEGSVDFIFGNATVLLEHCHIHCKSKGFITAQQRKEPSESTGFVFLRCIITGNGSNTPYMHLGRPWAPHARVLFAYTWMDSCIMPVGWDNWSNSENEKTACFYEYRCSGPGSNLGKRVPWAGRLNESEVAKFCSICFIDSDQTWLSCIGKSPPSVPIPLSVWRKN